MNYKILLLATSIALTANLAIAQERGAAMGKAEGQKMERPAMQKPSMEMKHPKGKMNSAEMGDMKEGPKDGMGDRHKRMREEIPENVRAEIAEFRAKKKALWEALSPEAKAVLEKRRSKWMGKKHHDKRDGGVDNDNEGGFEDKKERKMDHRKGMEERMKDKIDMKKGDKKGMEEKIQGRMKERMKDRKDNKESPVPNSVAQ